ncbi:MAG: DUF1269 domain-containing protein [Xanthobacteraceae bacterium]
MNRFVVLSFPDQVKTDEAIRALRKLHSEGNIKLYASAFLARDSHGKLSVQEITKEGLGGTAVGALIGGLAGLPLGPLAATIGAAGGALIGNSADLLHQGDEAEFAEKISRELAPGKSAVVAEVDDDGVIAFEALMESIGGIVVRK